MSARILASVMDNRLACALGLAGLGIIALANLSWMLFVGLAAVAIVVAAHSVSPSVHDLAMLEDTPDLEQFLAEIRIYQFRYIGKDRGVMWIESDALHFCGQRSSFILGPQDFEVRGSLRLGCIHLRLRGLLQTSWVEILPLRAPGTDRKRLQKSVEHLAMTNVKADIPRQWPPFDRPAA